VIEKDNHLRNPFRRNSMVASTANPAESRKSSQEARVSDADLANHTWWASFWTVIEHWAFLAVVLALAIEFVALKLAEPHKEKLEAAKDLKIAELNNETARLKSQAAPRTLTKEQFNAIQTLKDRIPAINLAVEVDSECQMFAGILASALMNAGINVRGYSLPLNMRGSSGLVIYDQQILSDDSAGNVIYETLANAGVVVFVKLTRLPDALDMPRDIPAILVYERPSAPFISPPYFGSPDQAAPVPTK